MATGNGDRIRFLASVIAHNNHGHTTARVNQLRIGRHLLTRTGTTTFAITTDSTTLDVTLECDTRGQQWRVTIRGYRPTPWLTLAQAAEHITNTAP